MTTNDVVRKLVDAHPGFADAWREYVESPNYEPDHPYIDVGQLASRLVNAATTGELGDVAELFGAVEAILKDSPADIRDLVLVGFLEDLQNVSLNRGLSLESWEQWLPPRTLEGWRVVKGLWDGSVSKESFNQYIATGVVAEGSQHEQQ